VNSTITMAASGHWPSRKALRDGNAHQRVVILRLPVRMAIQPLL